VYDSFTFRSKVAGGAAGDPVTTDAFANVPISSAHQGYIDTKLIVPTSGPLSLNWKNTGANSIDSRVLGSNDPTEPGTDADWDIVAASAAIVAGASRHITINPGVYQFYKFQHKATGAGAQGASQIFGRNARI